MNRVWLLLTLLGAFALRTWRLGFQELRGDEAFGYFFSLRPYVEIVEQTLTLAEPHPVASYFMQKAWLAVGGHSEFSLRFVSVWFGLLAVALLYRLARRLHLPPASAAAAATLLAISPYAIWHSQDARMYSISLALTIASSWLAFEFEAAHMQRRDVYLSRKVPYHISRSRYFDSAQHKDGTELFWRTILATVSLAIAYLAVSLLALHVHYFAAFVLVAQNVYFVGQALVNRGSLLRWLTLQVVLSLLYLPWLWQARTILRGYDGNGDSPTFLAMLERTLRAFFVGESMPITPHFLFGIFAVLVLVYALAVLLRPGGNGGNSRQLVAFLLLYLFVPILISWVSARQRPIFNERYLIAAAPPFYLLIAASLSSINRAWLRATSWFVWPKFGLYAIFVFCMLFSLFHHYTNPLFSKSIGWRNLAATLSRLSENLPPSDVRLVENFPDPTLWYYYNGPVDHLVLPPAAHDIDAAQREVEALVESGVQRIVLAVQPAPNWDDQEVAQQALSRAYALVHKTTAGSATGSSWPVDVYVRPPDLLQAVDQSFQNGLRLVAASYAPSELSAGTLLVVHVQWGAAQAALTGTEKVFVHLADATGAPVAQSDRALGVAVSSAESGNDSTLVLGSYGILIPEEIPKEIVTGQYRLLVGIYDPAQDGAPRVLTVDGADFVEITPSVHVIGQ